MRNSQSTPAVLLFNRFNVTGMMTMAAPAPHLSPCWQAWPGWWAGTMTEAGSVSSGCSDWRASGRGWQRSPRRHTASSSTTLLDGRRAGGQRQEEGFAVGESVGCSACHVSTVRRCHLTSSGHLPLFVLSPLSFVAMEPETCARRCLPAGGDGVYVHT